MRGFLLVYLLRVSDVPSTTRHIGETAYADFSSCICFECRTCRPPLVTSEKPHTRISPRVSASSVGRAVHHSSHRRNRIRGFLLVYLLRVSDVPSTTRHIGETAYADFSSCICFECRTCRPPLVTSEKPHTRISPRVSASSVGRAVHHSSHRRNRIRGFLLVYLLRVSDVPSTTRHIGETAYADFSSCICFECRTCRPPLVTSEKPHARISPCKSNSSDGELSLFRDNKGWR